MGVNLPAHAASIQQQEVIALATVQVTPLTTTIGARIDGVDLRKPLSKSAAQSIRQALADYAVIVFHEQHIDLEQQRTFTSIFGPLECVDAHKLVGDNNSVTVLDASTYQRTDTERINPSAFHLKDEFPEWHVDSCFSIEIPAVACLRPEVLSPVGGGTCWAGMAWGYDALSETMQEWLETLDVVFAPPPGYRGYLGLANMPKEIQEKWDATYATHLHPLVVRHPVNGRKQLFVNPAYAVKIDKLSNSESAMLLRFLYGHATRPDFVYRHRWNMGDIVVWDELATAHLAPTDHYPHPRRVVRIFAGAVKPTAARLSA